jgi:hypothetical protein
MKTFQEIRNLLSVAEPDERIYAQITTEDIPQLRLLLYDGESWISARAILALSRIKNEAAYRLIKEATMAKRNIVRTAIAVALPFLPKTFAEEILNRLLKDEDFGVKRIAIYSIPDRPNRAIKNQLKMLALYDEHDFIKTISREKLAMLG